MTVHGQGEIGERAELDGPLIERICQECVRRLPVTGAAVSVLTVGGHRGTVYATDDTARDLEELQFTMGEGPGVDAFRLNRVVQLSDVTDTTAPSRWPAFAPAASRLPVRALSAFPLHLGAACLGVLTMYHSQPALLGHEDVARGLRLADSAASALLDLLSGTVDSPIGEGHGLDGLSTDPDFYRAEVYQASGMVMAQLAVTIEVAMVRLRAYAYAHGRPIGDVARDIVRRTLHLEREND